MTVLRVSHIHSGIPPDELMACMWVEMDNILPDSHRHRASGSRSRSDLRSLSATVYSCNLLRSHTSHRTNHDLDRTTASTSFSPRSKTSGARHLNHSSRAAARRHHSCGRAPPSLQSPTRAQIRAAEGTQAPLSHLTRAALRVAPLALAGADAAVTKARVAAGRGGSATARLACPLQVRRR